MKVFKEKIVFASILMLSVLVVGIAIYLYKYSPRQDILDLSQLAGTVAAFLAAIWFSYSLHFQSIQLKEQKEQFLESYKYLRQDAKRNTLQFCSELLEKTCEKIKTSYPDITSIQQIPTYFMNFEDFNKLLKSTDPNVVLEAAPKWFNREAPAKIFMNNLNFAALIYFDSVGITYKKVNNSEESFYINGSVLRDVPIFQEYYGLGEMLSQFLFTTKPGRESAMFAYQLALAMTLPPQVIKIDNIHDDYKRIKEKNYPIPALWEKFYKKYARK